MSMDKERKTSNILNIVQYDASGNVSIPNTLTTGGVATFNGASGSTQVSVSTFNNITNGAQAIVNFAGSASAIPSWNNGSVIYEATPFSTGNMFISAMTGSIIFQTNARTNALTINSSQVATFVSTVNANSFSGAGTGLTGTGSSFTAGKAIVLNTARTINGVSFDGSANITISATATAALTIGTGLSGTSYNGSTSVTIANSGVLSITASGFLTASAATGAITITNTLTNTNQLTNGAGFITATTSALTNYYTASTSDGRFHPLENQRLGTAYGPRFSDVYNTGWFRNDNSGTGLYNGALSNHWYADSSSQWNVAGTNNANAAIAIRCEGHGSTVRGYVYANTSNEVGFLNNGGSWTLRMNGGTAYASNFSGNWNGYTYDTAATASTMVLRDSSGHITGNYGFYSYINTPDNLETTATGFIIKNGDNYHRSISVANVAALMRAQGVDNDTLSSVTTRGSSTSTYSSFNGGATIYYIGGSSVPGSSYGSIRIDATTGGYGGIYLYSCSGTVVGMHDSSGNGGTWDPSTGWHFYWNRANTCLGLGGSTTSSSYRAYTNGSHYVAGDLYASGNVTSYSDMRKKRNINTIENALDKVLSLRGVTYEMKDKLGVTNMGVIAQEVVKVVPEVVTYVDHQYGVNYGNFAGLFIESFKTHNSKIVNHEDRIKELEEEILKLKKLIN